jgi:hypothetical protein
MRERMLRNVSSGENALRLFLEKYERDPRLLEAVYVYWLGHETLIHGEGFRTPWGSSGRRILEEELLQRGIDPRIIDELEARASSLELYSHFGGTSFLAAVPSLTKIMEKEGGRRPALADLVRSRISAMEAKERDLLSRVADYLLYIANLGGQSWGATLDRVVDYLRSEGVEENQLQDAFGTLYRAGAALFMDYSTSRRGYEYHFIYVRVPPWTVEALKSLGGAAPQPQPQAATPGPTEGTPAAQPPPEASLPPSREILEGVVAGALQDLGFTARVNDRRPSRTGSDVEVDVWAERPVGDMKFTVYASCKNWNRDVDRPVIDEELGRVLNLREMPHLRVLVVRSMGAPAKEVARADGFLVIELGGAVDETNAARAREIIRSKLRGIFVGIAPPELRRLAEMVEDASRVLSNIAGDLRSLAEGARFGADIT